MSYFTLTRWLWFLHLVQQWQGYKAEIKCGQPQISPWEYAKNGGVEVRQGSWPWQAYLTGEDFDCGGVLISANFVLTAAHCVTNLDTGLKSDISQLRVYLGLQNKAEINDKMLVQLRTIERVLVHPRFNAFNLTNDVAIITLAEPAKMTKYVDIVCVAQQPVPPKTPCYVTGYGLQAVDKISTNLREIRVPYADRRQCRESIKEFFPDKFLDDSMCCAGDPNNGTQDACQGDSGGPLVCRQNEHWELHGLVSWGSKTNCGQISRVLGIYANIPHLYNWISSNTNGQIPQFTTHPLTTKVTSTNSHVAATTTTLTTVATTSLVQTTRLEFSNERYCRPSYSGRYNIQLPNGTRMNVICDGKTDGGGWLLLSRRVSDNSIHFHTRTEPDPGWGQISGDFWLGTNVFHQLTSGPEKMELLLDMRLCDNNRVYRRKYKNFSVGDKQSGFELSIEPSPDEDSREGLSGSNGKRATCFDDLGRQHSVSCWWWSHHPAVSINAEVGCDIPPPINNFWFTRKPQRRLQIKTVEMKIRPMGKALARSSRPKTKRSLTPPASVTRNRRENLQRSPAELSDPKVPLRHCQEIYNLRGIHKSGVHKIQLDNGELKEVYCEMEVDGGGWTLLQRRKDGEEKFDRNWDDFAKGFGNVNKDFWLGNTAIHLLTSADEEMELRLDMGLCNGEKFVIKYKKFKVGPAESQFQLVNVEEPKYPGMGQWRYVGETEGLIYNKGWEFTTATDSSPDNCVRQMGGGGWWYNACGTFVNLNGKFGCDQSYPQGNFIFFSSIRQKRSIKTVAMMIKPIDNLDLANPGPTPLPPPEFPYEKGYTNCAQMLAKEPGKASGAYKLEIGENPAFVHCDMTTEGGGWMTLLRRENGLERFNRDWIDYTEGFGNAAKGDYWVGLRGLNVYYAGWDLRLEISWCDGGQSIFRYRNFGVDVGATKFRLTVEPKSGNSLDPFSRANGNSFFAANWGISTPNCGNTHGGGGWWWTDKQNCTDVNLTGKFGCEVPFPQNLYWVTSRSAESLKKNVGKPDFRRIKTVQMKIRPPR